MLLASSKGGGRLLVAATTAAAAATSGGGAIVLALSVSPAQQGTAASAGQQHIDDKVSLGSVEWELEYLKEIWGLPDLMERTGLDTPRPQK